LCFVCPFVLVVLRQIVSISSLSTTFFSLKPSPNSSSSLLVRYQAGGICSAKGGWFSKLPFSFPSGPPIGSPFIPEPFKRHGFPWPFQGWQFKKPIATPPLNRAEVSKYINRVIGLWSSQPTSSHARGLELGFISFGISLSPLFSFAAFSNIISIGLQVHYVYPSPRKPDFEDLFPPLCSTLAIPSKRPRP